MRQIAKRRLAGNTLTAGRPGIDGEGSPPYADFPDSQQFILHHAALLGLCASWFIQTLWTQAAQHTYQQSVELLDCAHRYTPDRLERACQRALLHHLEGLPALRFILAEHLDRLPTRADAEPSGQLRLPIADSWPA